MNVSVIYSINRQRTNFYVGQLQVGGVTIGFLTRYGGDHNGFWNITLRGVVGLTKAQRTLIRAIFTEVIGDPSGLLSKNNAKAEFKMSAQQKELLEQPRFGCIFPIEVEKKG